MAMTESSCFPPSLLEQPPAAKLHYFKGVTVPHHHLQSALNQLLLHLQEPADISVLFIVGPTGVGKTTLRLRAEKVLAEEYLSTLLDNPGQIAVAAMEVVASEQSKFSHRDYYIRALEAIGEILANYKSSYGIHTTPDPIHTSKSSAALRRALENVLRCRQVKTFMIDEAQHLLMTAGAHQMLQQMNWIKSIANITNTTHALFGTYDLLNCCRLSGQLSRRSDDVHIPRYRGDIQADVTEFVRVVQTFQRHLPLEQEPQLEQWYEYLLEYSIGCVGILNTWLIRAFRNALVEDAKTLTLKHLQQTAYSAPRRQQLQEEAEAGERRLQESKSSIVISTVLPTDQPRPARQSRQGRVGKRHPKRDPVGVKPNVN
jgi:AAA domain